MRGSHISIRRACVSGLRMSFRNRFIVGVDWAIAYHFGCNRDYVIRLSVMFRTKTVSHINAYETTSPIKVHSLPSGTPASTGAFLAFIIPGGILALLTTSKPLPFSLVLPPNRLFTHPAADAGIPVGSAGPVFILRLGILALSAGPRTP